MLTTYIIEMLMINIFIIIFLFSTLISVLFHYVYTKFPNKISSIFFPVNESIWEHMKLIASSIVCSILFEIFLFSALNIQANNLFFANALAIIIGIILYLIIYLTYRKYKNHNALVAIGLLILDFLFINYISFRIMFNTHNNFNVLGVILIFIIYIVFYYLTYNPLKTFIFYDEQKKKYGI